MAMQKLKLGYAFCGSFCTINKSLAVLKELAKTDIDITPIMSQITYTTDTRFAKSSEFNAEVEKNLRKTYYTHNIRRRTDWP